MKIKTELNPESAQQLFSVIRQNKEIFHYYSKKEFTDIADCFKFLSFTPGIDLVKYDEEVKWLGIIVEGKAAIKAEKNVLGKLEQGDMIGYMSLCKVPDNKKHLFTITSYTNGYIAIITFTDLYSLRTKKPILVLIFRLNIGIGF